MSSPEQTFPRHVAPDTQLKLSILIGNAQSGEWWIWVDGKLFKTGTDTSTIIPLGAGGAYYDKLIQLEVRCDHTNPQTDRLSARIELTPVTPALSWSTNNEGAEVPNDMMSIIANIFVLPVSP